MLRGPYLRPASAGSPEDGRAAGSEVGATGPLPTRSGKADGEKGSPPAGRMTDYHEQRIQNRVADKPAQAIGFGEMSRYLALAMMLACLLIAYPWIHSEILKLGYQIQDLKRENALLREQHQALVLEQAAWQSPQRIDEYARERLGLVPASSAQVIVIQEDSLPGRQVVAQTIAPQRSQEAAQ